MYQYRLTDQEFGDLTALLKLSSNFGLKHATGMLMWDAAMVFYAAEWWRRHYVGHWGWEGIFDSLGFLADDISTGRRGEIVEVGLRRWHREVRSFDGRRRFLGTVATEGGLALNQLAESGGWLGTVLQSVVDDIS